MGSLELRACIADVRLTLAQLRFAGGLDEWVRKYRQDQPRAPRGTPDGGQWIDDLGNLFRTEQNAGNRIRVAQVGPDKPTIPSDKMLHIINAHGFYTPRTKPGNSRFFAEYSTPTAIQDMANELYRQRRVPEPWKTGLLWPYSGDFNDVDLNTGTVTPIFIGTDGNGHLSNRVRILFNPETGIVQTMYPISAK